MKDFFKLQISNKKLLPCLAIVFFLFLLIYFLSVHLQKEPEIVEAPKIITPTVKPKTPVIMTYPSRDPFRPIVKSSKPIEQQPEVIPPSSNHDNTFVDQTIPPITGPTESTNQDTTTSINGIMTSGGVSSALIHTPSGTQIVSMGDFVPGLGRVTQITANRVILQDEINQTTLTLGGE